MNKPPLLVIKIGGNIIDDDSALNTFLSDFASLEGHKILVHGGGKLATELSTKLGIETKLVDGRRITDEETIRVVTMTYAGWINKNIVAKLQSKDCTALGICGADVNLLPAVKRPVKDIDYGFVGDLDGEWVNDVFLRLIVDGGVAPVIAPITSDYEGNLLNVNADTVAQTLAQALSEFYDTTLIYCFEKNGLLLDVNDNASALSEINRKEAEALKAKGIISKGMLPKIDNAFNAISKGVQNVVIGHASFIKQMALKETGYGTYIKQ